MSRPGVGGHGSTPQARSSSARARGVGDRTATGQQGRQAPGVDRAALTGPPRHPGQLRAGARGQRGRGGQRTRRPSPAARRRRITAPSRAQRRRARAAVARRSSAAASSPGTVPDAACAPSLRQHRARRTARRDVDRQRVRASGRLAQPQEDDRALLLGLEADQHHRRRRLQRRVRRRASGVVPGHRARRGTPNSSSLRAAGPGSRCRWCRARPGRTWRTRRRPRRSAGRRAARRRRRCRGPRAAPRRPRSSASGQRRLAPARRCSSRTIGVGQPVGLRSRSGSAQRPLSQFHSSLTSGSSPASRRMHLAAPPVGALRAAGRAVLADAGRGLTRSNGRARNRYGAPVSAPTGQICTVLPEK